MIGTEDRLLTIQELADRINMPLSTVRAYYREWGLIPYRIGRHLRFSEPDVTAWLAKHKERHDAA